MAGKNTRSATSAVPTVQHAMLANILWDGNGLARTVAKPVTRTSVVVIKAVPTVTNDSRIASESFIPWARQKWYRVKKWIVSSTAMPMHTVNAQTLVNVKV